MWNFSEHEWHANKVTLNINANANVHICKKFSWQKNSWMFLVAICKKYVLKYYIWNKPSTAKLPVMMRSIMIIYKQLKIAKNKINKQQNN